MPKITIETSDGDKGNWPAGWLDHAVPISSNENYHEKVKPGHAKYILFCQKIGQHLATVGGLSNPVNYELSDLPSGYALFLHHKLQKSGEDRTDIYMFGSKNVLKFRSPAEFFGHAEWLQKGDIKDHGKCTCKYSGNYTITAGPGAEAKRKAAPQAAKGPQKKVKTSDEEELITYKKKQEAAIHVRQDEVKSDRWFRKGELVWAKIPTIRPGPGSTIAVGIQEIDYWPAIVTEPVLKVHADAGEPGAIMQSTQYSLRYCGRLDQVSGEGPHKTTATLNETEILPWHMYSPTRPELGAVAKKYALSVAEASITLNNGESAEEKRVKSWRRETIQRAWPIAEAIKPDNWERMVTIYTEALVLANEMSMLWSQTDPYSHMDNIPFKHDFLADKSYFQGLWWGAERIWLGDLIRLVRSRSSLVQDARLKAFAPGADQHAAFLRITQISVQQMKRETSSTFHCMVHGDLFELAEPEWIAQNDPQPQAESSAAGAANGQADAATADDTEHFNHLPAAPKGLVYRQVNEPHSEVMCDIFDIAGRVYSTLDESPLVKAGQKDGDDGAENDSDDTKERQTRLNALMGVAPVGEIKTIVKDWKNTRYEAVRYAHAVAVKHLAGVFESDRRPGLEIPAA
ncbi:hypothetical protein HD553DRAFT_302931 [Filobasidium floriforme]|uniref:uncharacterized protein n=1 Tax=Filobasidium floriforme TaxID=5210 RepID=UPI001E8E24E2|nr:uncharacterized protein HD553DRAFT_302931 [Filobasidium floriforme]KAH8090629.1 hypothetical protein HD553DRAFT_302931 [Filobasidium floriforme]